jgi:RNA polymerase sigma-70 factor (ECF subfamily)
MVIGPVGPGRLCRARRARRRGGIIEPKKTRNVAEGTLLEFSRVYEAYRGKVVAYAAKLLGRAEAEDVAQEVFIKVARSLGDLADASKLSAWIYAVTLNTVRDLARRRSIGLPLAAPRASREGESAVAPAPDVPDTVSRTAQETAIRNEMVACYLDYVNALPPGYQQVYVLTEFEGLSNQEIAERLDLSLATVKIRLHRARTRLHEALRANCRCYVNERGELMGEPKDRSGAG